MALRLTTLPLAATITYTDINGSESESATASLSVAFQRGFVINGETADDLVGMSISSAGDVNALETE
jgi:hypothetical protein